MVTALQQNPSMAELTAQLRTKSDKIRALHRAGYRRTDIARFLDIRYQHVRNVIVQDEQKGRSLPSAASPETEVRWVEVAADGRMTLPIAYRKILGVENGGSVFVTIDDSGLRLESRAVALKRVRDMVAPYLKGRPSMVDELIAERRAEAAREDLS